MLFVGVNVITTLLPSMKLTGAVWDSPRFTFKHASQQSSRDLLRAVRPDDEARRVFSSNIFGILGDNTMPNKPDEYEACERVRFNSFVRAPCNAWSSLAFLSAPAFQILSNEHLWAGRTRGLRGLAAGFGLVSTGMGTALT